MFHHGTFNQTNGNCGAKTNGLHLTPLQLPSPSLPALKHDQRPGSPRLAPHCCRWAGAPSSRAAWRAAPRTALGDRRRSSPVGVWDRDAEISVEMIGRRWPGRTKQRAGAPKRSTVGGRTGGWNSQDPRSDVSSRSLQV